MGTDQNDPVDFSKQVEGALLGTFLLIGKSFKTAFDFTVRPKSFASKIQNKDPLITTVSFDYARPLTFFFFSVTMMVVALYLYFKISGWGALLLSGLPFFAYLLDGLKDGSFIKIVFSLSFFILSLGLYAKCLQLSCKIFRGTISFRDSLFLSAYFFGTICFTYAIFSPNSQFLTEYSNRRILNGIGLLIVGVGWILLFKIFFSFYVVLKTIANMKWLKTVLMLLASFAIFATIFYMIRFWTRPLIHRLVFPSLI